VYAPYGSIQATRLELKPKVKTRQPMLLIKDTLRLPAYIEMFFILHHQGAALHITLRLNKCDSEPYPQQKGTQARSHRSEWRPPLDRWTLQRTLFSGQGLRRITIDVLLLW